MLNILLLFSLLQEPLTVSIGDNVPSVPIESLSGNQLLLSDVLEKGFCFFISNSCQECIDSMPVIIEKFASSYECVFIFVDNSIEKDSHLMLSKLIDPEVQVFFANSRALIDELNLTSLPVMLAFDENGLKVAMHGPISEATSTIILDHYLKK